MIGLKTVGCRVDGDARAHVRKSCLLIDVLTVKEITENRNVSVGSCHEILVVKFRMRCHKIGPSVDVVKPKRQSRHRLSRIVRPRK